MNTFKLTFGLALVLLLAACGSDSLPGADPDLLFADNFAPGEVGDWQIEGDAAGQTTLLNENLVIEIDEPNVMQFATLQTPGFTDFILEVDVRQLQGDLQSSFGVLFRMQNPNQFYRFEITGNGMFMLERRNGDGTWTRFLEDWVDSSAIRQGYNEVNRLKIRAIGPNISIFANDMLLFQGSDSAYTSGTIALDAGTFTQPGLQVAFDNLEVREP
jgi:hypothetical protein